MDNLYTLVVIKAVGCGMCITLSHKWPDIQTELNKFHKNIQVKEIIVNPQSNDLNYVLGFYARGFPTLLLMPTPVFNSLNNVTNIHEVSDSIQEFDFDYYTPFFYNQSSTNMLNGNPDSRPAIKDWLLVAENTLKSKGETTLLSGDNFFLKTGNSKGKGVNQCYIRIYPKNH